LQKAKILREPLLWHFETKKHKLIVLVENERLWSGLKVIIPIIYAHGIAAHVFLPFFAGEYCRLSTKGSNKARVLSLTVKLSALHAIAPIRSSRSTAAAGQARGGISTSAAVLILSAVLAFVLMLLGVPFPGDGYIACLGALLVSVVVAREGWF
jgi:hypothetical protein